MSSYPDELELLVERMAQGGAGVGRWEGRVIFAAGGLPGERVRVRLSERRARYAHGHVVAVQEPAPERIAPRLPGADHISWQHIDYAAQLGFKQTILREQLARLAGLEVPVAPVLPAAQPWGYRNTAHLRIDAARGLVGYYAASSHTLRDLPADPLLLPALNEALAGLRRLLVPDAWPVVAVTLRGSGAYGYAVAALHGLPNHAPADSLENLGWRWSAHVPSLAAAAPEVGTRGGSPVTLHEELGEIVFALSPASFFQSNTAQAARLLDVVRELLALQPSDHLLDAYSGVGAFALPLARHVQTVVAIEEHHQAVADGEASAQQNDVGNVTFLAAPVERALASLTAPLDAAILDPPRRGCHPAALQALADLAPTRIAYVSCQPGILARDLRLLIERGYALRAVQPVDLFPQTPHIECVALLDRTGDATSGNAR